MAKAIVKVSSNKSLLLFNKQKIDIATRIATISILALQKDRIFAGGRDADGKYFGNYKNDSYLNYRAKKYNRTNSNINFVLSAEMSNEYTFGINNIGKYSLGFNQKPNGGKNPNGSQKAEYLEVNFKGLFNLSKKESKLFTEIFNKNLK